VDVLGLFICDGWSKICQISCCNVEKRRRWSLKDFWEILFICDLVKLMRSLVRVRPVLWKMFFDFFCTQVVFKLSQEFWNDVIVPTAF